MDAWFTGFQPTLTAVTWIGYDTPRKLGVRETGGGLSLPIWIRFMEHALNNVPVADPLPPAGVVYSGGDWFYNEYARGGGVASLGMESSAGGEEAPGAVSMPKADEKKNILDLFRN
jgi:penicillin-binding protein 1A